MLARAALALQTLGKALEGLHSWVPVVWGGVQVLEFYSLNNGYVEGSSIILPRVSASPGPESVAG